MSNAARFGWMVLALGLAVWNATLLPDSFSAVLLCADLAVAAYYGYALWGSPPDDGKAGR